MASTSKKSVTRSKSTPARRVRRTSATADAVQAAPTTAQISQLAYHYFEESGYVHGHDLEHWLRAESTLRSGV